MTKNALVPVTSASPLTVPSSSPFPLSFCNNIIEREERAEEMIPQDWAPPCGNQCTQKFAALTQIPWRVFCKKGCDADGDTWEECLGECNEICYKDPVLKDQQWSAYIDRSPGAASYSQECFHACVAGCGYKFDIPSEKVNQVHPNRPTKPPTVEKPKPLLPKVVAGAPLESSSTTENMPSTSA